MRILGIHSGHGCGVALIEDGRCVYAASEERFSRKKVAYGFPRLALQDCLRYLKLSPGEIDRVSLSVFNPVGTWSSVLKARWARVRHCGWRSLLLFEYPNEKKVWFYKGPLAFVLNLLALTGAPTFIAYFLVSWLGIRRALGWRIPLDLAGHHESHALAAAYTCGQTEPLSIVSEGYDGSASLKYDQYDRGLTPRRLATTPMPHSPGEFYACPTIILGFNPYKHCGKITGLAAFGDPRVLQEKVRALMWAEDGELRVAPRLWNLCVDYAQTGRLPDYFAGATKEQIAAAFQAVLEETQMQTFDANLAKVGTSNVNVCLSGGTFANVRLNQRFIEHPGVASVFVVPPMGDEGQPLGAALVSTRDHDQAHWNPGRIADMYLGPSYSVEEMQLALDQAKLAYVRCDAIETRIAQLLHAGKVVARFDGRMEFGPRALGNRSILARPTDPAVNDWLNQRLKRTEFMPFAPSVLDQALPKLFLGHFEKAVLAAEFMTITFDCTPWMKQHCPAVVHVDGTARPQIVTRKANPSYYRIIEEYEKLSGLPVVINTSFNMHEEPIVCTPQDAVRAYQQGHLDVLAMGPFLVGT